MQLQLVLKAVAVAVAQVVQRRKKTIEISAKIRRQKDAEKSK
jgi:hypothetical protein